MSELQFDRAEFVAPKGQACGVCQATICDQYYVANGKMLCVECHRKLQASFAQVSDQSRFWGALGWGGGAALLGAALYYGIRVATGYELGLVAIVVGVLVGKGVARGMRHGGGRGYAFMAVLLTYFAIVLTYLPGILKVWSQRAASGAGVNLTSSLLMAGMTLVLPFVVGFKAPLSLVIMGIALFEAWKFTRRATITITGPHTIAAVPPVPAATATNGD